eukprot:10254966-Prorocentrum_lima.AAC.1
MLAVEGEGDRHPGEVAAQGGMRVHPLGARMTLQEASRADHGADGDSGSYRAALLDALEQEIHFRLK